MLFSYDEEGAFGVILNRALDVDVNAIISQTPLSISPIPPKPTLFGGPVGMTSCMALFEGERSIDSGHSIVEEDQRIVSLSPSLKELERLIEEDIPFELLLGSAGWSAGQLDEEIQEGSWLYTDISPFLLFTVPPAERYSLALTLMGLEPEMLWHTPFEA